MNETLHWNKELQQREHPNSSAVNIDINSQPTKLKTYISLERKSRFEYDN